MIATAMTLMINRLRGYVMKNIETDRTLHVDVGDGAMMTLPKRDWLYNLNWNAEPERGTQATDRMLACSVLESYLYLVTECNRDEAWRRIKLMRTALSSYSAPRDT